MRDKKESATLDLPGFGPAEALAPFVTLVKPMGGKRIRRIGLKQVQLELLEPTDNSGLPHWRRDQNIDLTGLPVWAPA